MGPLAPWGPAQARSCRGGFVLAGVSLGPATGDKEGRLMATSCPKSEWPSDSSGSKSPTRGHSQGLHATPLVCRARLARSCEGPTPSPWSPASPSLSDLGLGSWQWPCGPQGPQGNKGFWGHCPGPGLSLRVSLGMVPVPRGSSVCDLLPAKLPTDPVCREATASHSLALSPYRRSLSRKPSEKGQGAESLPGCSGEPQPLTLPRPPP